MSYLAITMIANAAPTPFVRPQLSQDPIRVRVAQSSTFALSGTNLTINDRAYKGVQHFIVSNGQLKDGVRVESITGEDIRVNLKSVPPILKLAGRNLIATLDLETYLKGVLPAEMPASWPLEALKAQAVAARTFAIYRRQQSLKKLFDVDSDVMDQMFAQGTAATKNATKNAVKAIDETRGQVLTKNGAVVAAYFHADCGGHTEDARNVWGTNDSAGTTADGGCPRNPKANWSLKVSIAELNKKLRQKILTLEVNEKNVSGRVTEVYLALADGRGETMTANEFRSKMGFGDLRSTAFSIAREGDEYVFKGRGFGHGVGLCQWGARQMAQAGKSYGEILAHYYSQARVERDPKPILDRHPDLNDEERNGADNKQAAQFHNKPFPSL